MSSPMPKRFIVYTIDCCASQKSLNFELRGSRAPVRQGDHEPGEVGKNPTISNLLMQTLFNFVILNKACVLILKENTHASKNPVPSQTIFYIGILVG